MTDLKDSIGSFFQGINEDSVIFLTTFGLDEVALTKLLQENNIKKGQRIVVFHEIMKRRNPGYLLNHYHNSIVVSVVLKKRGGERCCPVFHSKIWMEIDPASLRCNRIAVHSINLTRYHLDATVRTMESFAFWKGLNLKLPKNKMFNSSIFNGTKHYMRLKMDPQTVVFDTTHVPTLEITSEPVINIVENFFIRHPNEKVLACAAPFVSKGAVTRLSKEKNITVFSRTRRRDDMRLHLKAVETNRYLISGSPNLTCQAFGIQGTPINHEAVALIKKGRFNLQKLLRGFPRLKTDSIPDSDDVEDIDEDDARDADWHKQKDEAVKAPLRVFLQMNNKTRRVQMHITGSLGNIDRINVLRFTGDEYSQCLSLGPRKIITFKKKEQQVALVKAITAPVTPIVKGMKGRKKEWRTELDLGDFWKFLDLNVGSMSKWRGGSGDGEEKNGNDSYKGQPFADVRLLRNTAYAYEDHAEGISSWLDWIKKYSGEAQLREWCLKLAKKLKEKADD